MLPNWLEIDYDQLYDGKFIKKFKPNTLLYHLPEHLLDSICKFHKGVYQFKQNYLSMLWASHIHELVKITCLILGEEHIVSNPYIVAGFL